MNKAYIFYGIEKDYITYKGDHYLGKSLICMDFYNLFFFEEPMGGDIYPLIQDRKVINANEYSFDKIKFYNFYLLKAFSCFDEAHSYTREYMHLLVNLEMSVTPNSLEDFKELLKYKTFL